MNYKLELKSAKLQNGKTYNVITITDFAFHTNNLRSTPIKNIVKSLEKNQPGRIYGSAVKPQGNTMKMTFLESLMKDPEFIKYVQEEEKNGRKVLLKFAKTGVPIFPGKDTIEFMNSVKGKRILRRLAKGKSMGV